MINDVQFNQIFEERTCISCIFIFKIDYQCKSRSRKGIDSQKLAKVATVNVENSDE